MKTHIFYTIPWYGPDAQRHAQEVMAELARDLHFEIVESRPQSALEGWEFWLEHDGKIRWPKDKIIHELPSKG